MLTRDEMRSNFEEALRLMDQFPRGDAPAQRAARRIATQLQELGIPYVVVGGLAVAAHGHLRATVDVDLILTREGLAAFKARWLGVGWVEQFAGSKGLRDAESGVKIDILTPDEKPGDGKSCPFHFPSPEDCGEDLGGVWQGVRILPLREVIELKLASGLSSPARLQDHADVLALIRVHGLPRAYAQGLHEYVRSKYDELWLAARDEDARSGSR